MLLFHWNMPQKVVNWIEWQILVACRSDISYDVCTHNLPFLSIHVLWCVCVRLLNASFRFVSLHCFQRNQLGVQSCVDLWSLSPTHPHCFLSTPAPQLTSERLTLMEYKLIERLSQLITYWDPLSCAPYIKSTRIWTFYFYRAEFLRLAEYSKDN